MKILLAAGVFYPDVGGPAIHVRKIAERLSQEGLEPTVLAYGDDPSNQKFTFKIKRISRRHNKAVQWLLYLFHTLCLTAKSKLVYAFDPTAAGIPACVASYIFGKPFVIRIGGDPIWEREAEMGRRLMPITDYYEKELYKKDRPTLFKAIKWVVKHADTVVFYNQFWKDFYHKYFSLPLWKIKIVKNPVFKREKASTELNQDPQIIFAGRFVSYKNLPLVINAFHNIRNEIKRGKLVLIGKGPDKEKLLSLVRSLGLEKDIEFLESLPQEKLFERIKESSIAIGPALSEFNPNFILESLSFGKPVILSKGHGLSVDLPTEFVFDPLSQKDLESKLRYLLQPENYKKAAETVAGLDMNQTWEKVTDFHTDMIREYLGKTSDHPANFIQSLFKKNTILRYLVAGITGASTQIGLLYVFTDIVGLWYIYSSIIAFIVSIIVSFTLQKFWTFADKEIKKIHHQFARYMTVAVLGVFINTGFMYFWVDIIGFWYIFAQIITGAIIAVFNFLMYKFFIFNRYRK